MLRGAACALLSLAIAVGLACPAGAYRQTGLVSETLGNVIDAFMEEYGLTEDNFSFGYVYLDTGETWYYNRDKMMVGGSLYKLPLNMIYADRLADGTYSPDTTLNGGYTIENAQFKTLVQSNNNAADAMQSYLMGWQMSYHDYRILMAQYTTFTEDDFTDEYLLSNKFSPRFMVETLEYLYDHSDKYEQVIEYLKQAQPEQYFKREVDEYEIAQKYGYLEWQLNDVAIVYTDAPFILVIFTKSVYRSVEAVGAICSIMCDYTNDLQQQYELFERAEAERLAAEAAAVESAEPSPETLPQGSAEDEISFFPVAAAVAVLAALLAATIAADVHRKKKTEKENAK